jgi:hypothetical protein
MSTKKGLLTSILRALERIEDRLDTMVENTSPGTIDTETLKKFGLDVKDSEAELLTEEEIASLKNAEKALYEDDEG